MDSTSPVTIPSLPLAAWTAEPVPDSRPPAPAWAPLSDPDESLARDRGQLPLPFLATGRRTMPEGDPATVSRIGEESAGLPDVTAWSGALAQALHDAISGRRPVGQLTRWADDRVLSALTAARRGRTAGRDRPAQLLSVRTQLPTPYAAEVCTRLATAHGTLTLAFRLEAVQSRWLCTAVETRLAEPVRVSRAAATTYDQATA